MLSLIGNAQALTYRSLAQLVGAELASVHQRHIETQLAGDIDQRERIDYRYVLACVRRSRSPEAYFAALNAANAQAFELWGYNAQAQNNM